MNESNLYPYQQVAAQHIYDNPHAALLLDMGLGKTVSTLTTVNRLKYDDFTVDKVLIIAPKRVAESVWHTEAQKWDHLKHLTFSLVLGNERKRKEALNAKADIYVINRENVVWLQAYLGGAFPFDMLVIDELSSFKSAKSARFKSLRIMRPRISRLIGLTGTPMPNGLLDLWPQLYLLDQGERLGKTLGSYQAKYFKPGKRNGHVVYSYDLVKEKDEVLGDDINAREIFDKISDICISMKAEDYLDLPQRLDQIVEIDLPPELMQQYLDFERDTVLAYAQAGELTGDEISAPNAAALTGKLLQFANGAVYRADKTYMEIHDCKIDALAEDLEAANGSPMIVFYQFKSDAERIMKKLKAFKPHMFDPKHTLRDVDAWNRGEIPLLLTHAASAGHGLNLQYGGHLMWWFGRPWSLELYQQGVTRVDRQGQTHVVVNRTGVIKGTMEEEVIKALARKDAGQEALMQAVKARVQKYLH